MALVNLETVLRHSVAENYAVGSFNVANHSMVDAILQAGEQAGLPMIVSLAETHFKYINLEAFVAYLKLMIDQVSVPVALHLDHGTNLETLHWALDNGFSSVMLDASAEPFADNVKLTYQAVKLAQAYGASVEGELVIVGGSEGDSHAVDLPGATAYTEPEQAITFVEETGIHALAIAIGTVHGLYHGKLDLQFDLLGEIRATVGVPLVLHGGSGLSPEIIEKLVQGGINKVNIFTDNSLAATEQIRRKLLANSHANLGYPDLVVLAQEKIKEMVLHYMTVFKTQPLAEKEVEKC